MLATLYLYQVLDFLHPPVNSKLQNDINIRCSVLATLYIFWNLYIHTRCLMLATLYLYQVETVHPYQLLDVGYTTPIPGVGCWRYYTCSYIRCWRQYIYNRCWMLATLYAYTRCFIPMVYHWDIYTDGKTNILSICNKTDLKMSATVYLCLVFA